MTQPITQADNVRTRWSISHSIRAAEKNSPIQEIHISLTDTPGDVACLSALPPEVQQAIQADLSEAGLRIRGRIDAWVLLGEKETGHR